MIENGHLRLALIDQLIIQINLHKMAMMEADLVLSSLHRNSGASSSRKIHSEQKIAHKKAPPLTDGAFEKNAHFLHIHRDILIAQLLDHTWVCECRGIAKLLALGNITQNTAHDLTGTRLGQIRRE